MKARILLTLLLLASVLGAAEKINYFPRYKVARLTQEQLATNAPAAIVLDGEIYEQTESLLSDLRVLNSDGKALPYLLEKMQRTKPVERLLPVPVRIANTTRNDDGSVVFTLTLPQFLDNLVRLEVISNSRNFDRKVKIEFLGQNGEWRTAADDRPVFDYSGTYEFRRTGIAFPPAGGKQARVTIRPLGESELSPVLRLLNGSAPHADENGFPGSRDSELNVTDLVFLQNNPFEKSVPATREFTPEVTRYEEVDGETVIGLEAKHHPITRFEIQSDTPVFIRRVVVLGGSSPDKLRPLLESSISRLLPDEQPAIELGGEMRLNCYEIRIRNNTRPPLEAPSVSASGPVYQLVLLPPGDEALRVYFGAEAPTPDYDVKLLLRRTGRTVYATLGPRHNNPEFRQGPAAFDTRTLLIALAGGFILAALLLALKIFKPFGAPQAK